MPVTREQLAAIMPQAAAAGRIDVWFAPLVASMAAYEITTPPRIAMFLGNIAEETGELAAREENLRYSGARLRQIFPAMFRAQPQLADQLAAQGPEAIANHIYADRNRPVGYRMGNVNPGDGWRYRGRGPMQLTGRGNYARFFRSLGMPEDSNPDLVLSPEIGAKSACHFWKAAGCNEVADGGDFTAVVRLVNGGTINMDKRLHYYAAAQQALATLPPPDETAVIDVPAPAALLEPVEAEKGAGSSKTMWGIAGAGASVVAGNAGGAGDAISHASAMASQASTFMGSIKLFLASLGGLVTVRTIIIAGGFAMLCWVAWRYRKKIRNGLVRVL